MEPDLDLFQMSFMYFFLIFYPIIEIKRKQT